MLKSQLRHERSLHFGYSTSLLLQSSAFMQEHCKGSLSAMDTPERRCSGAGSYLRGLVLLLYLAKLFLSSCPGRYSSSLPSDTSASTSDRHCTPALSRT